MNEWIEGLDSALSPFFFSTKWGEEDQGAAVAGSEAGVVEECTDVSVLRPVRPPPSNACFPPALPPNLFTLQSLTDWPSHRLSWKTSPRIRTDEITLSRFLSEDGFGGDRLQPLSPQLQLDLYASLQTLSPSPPLPVQAAPPRYAPYVWLQH